MGSAEGRDNAGAPHFVCEMRLAPEETKEAAARRALRARATTQTLRRQYDAPRMNMNYHFGSETVRLSLRRRRYVRGRGEVFQFDDVVVGVSHNERGGPLDGRPRSQKVACFEIPQPFAGLIHL